MGDTGLYRRLQQHLDRMPVGYPPTKSGVEIRILRRLFTPEEAEIALALSAFPEQAEVVRRRLRLSLNREELRCKLDAMASKGLIERRGSGDRARYGKSMFVVGIYERQIDRLTPELQRDALQYFDEGLSEANLKGRTRQLRTVPVGKAIPTERGIGQYDDVRNAVHGSKGPFAAMPCVCRQGRELIGEKCRHDIASQNCLTLGPAATAVVDWGVAHYVSRDEMLGLLDRADRDGLVLQPQNTQNPLFVCCCCGCCCGVLTNAKKLDRPAQFFNTNYYAEVDPAQCAVCGECLERCQMDAVVLDGAARVIRERCIGCGLCVTTCPSGAMRLEANQHLDEPPADTGALYKQIYRERYGPLGLLAAAGKKALGLKV